VSGIFKEILICPSQCTGMSLLAILVSSHEKFHLAVQVRSHVVPVWFNKMVFAQWLII